MACEKEYSEGGREGGEGAKIGGKLQELSQSVRLDPLKMPVPHPNARAIARGGAPSRPEVFPGLRLAANEIGLN